MSEPTHNPDAAINYDGPDESVECAYPGCSNKLRRSEFNGPQFCSKEHRDDVRPHPPLLCPLCHSGSLTKAKT